MKIYQNPKLTITMNAALHSSVADHGTAIVKAFSMKGSTSANTPLPQLKLAETLARLMDAQFKIPGTNIRFGLDPILGLIPGAGDMLSFLVSGYMLIILARNGASGYVLARMVLNIVIDALVGSVPILGDIFDVGFKANQLNMRLMREHYVQDRHKGGAWKVIVPILLLVAFFIAAIAWLMYKLFNLLRGYFA